METNPYRSPAFVPPRMKLPLGNLIIESACPKEENSEKRLYRFDESLKALKERVYHRHLYPSESFQLIGNVVENSSYKSIREDMLKIMGEWLSMAFKREGDILYVALDPRNIIWDAAQNTYVTEGGIQCSELYRFDLMNVSWCEWHSPKEFCEDFVKLLYSEIEGELMLSLRRLFTTRFPFLKEQLNDSKIIALPMQESLWLPCGLRGRDLTIYTGYEYLGASRGVIEF